MKSARNQTLAIPDKALMMLVDVIRHTCAGRYPYGVENSRLSIDGFRPAPE